VAGLFDADILRTSITPVLEAELCQLGGPPSEAFLNCAVVEYNANHELSAKAPAEIYMERVEGLNIVHVTHAADKHGAKSSKATQRHRLYMDQVCLSCSLPL
jgi:hypothetical protein